MIGRLALVTGDALPNHIDQQVLATLAFDYCI
jgi:hypothetical protein